MAIGIENQFFFSFSLEGKEDFIDEPDLESFTLIEEAGNVLPTYELNFNTTDSSILPLLNEGNDLNIQMGKSRAELKDVSLNTIKTSSEPGNQNETSFSIMGMLSALDYITNSGISVSTKKSGIEVLEDIITPFFKPVFNVSKSRDKQNWIRHNISSKKFVNELWMHSDLLDSFPAIGITADKKFILKDVKKDLDRNFANQFDWKFTKNPLLPTDIGYDAKPRLKTETGFLNNWIGNGRELLDYCLEEGTAKEILEMADPILALTQKLAKRSSLEKRFAGVGMQNENTHLKYWQSYYHNLVNLALLGSVTLELTFQNRFVDINILDLVMFKDDNVEGEIGSNEFTSGLYYVSKVSRTVQARQLTTRIQLVRESLNQIQIKQ